MARRAHGRAIPISGGVDALLQAAHEQDARVVALASPNDPTGELLPAAAVERLLEGLPDGVAVLLDESLVEFVDAQPVDATIGLLESHPRLLVFRSFSKAWGLAGLRVGYALGGPGSEDLLAELEPDLGVSEVSQAGALEALRSCSGLLASHVRQISRGAPTPRRPRCASASFDVADSQANFLWAAHSLLEGRRAGRAPGARRRAGRRRRGSRRAPPRAHQPAQRRRHGSSVGCDRQRARRERRRLGNHGR